jgi:hypothetical protein
MSWWGSRRGRRRQEGPEPVPIRAASVRSLPEECAAFLRGDYADYLVHDGAPIPMWARLNPLCHRDEQGVAALAAGRVPGDEAWGAATTYLAEEVLCASARHGTSVSEIQRSVLIPLELELASMPQRVAARPAVLVRAVLRALQEYPSLRHPIA